MNTENNVAGQESLDNALDIRALACAFWRGKWWAAGGGLLFALLALAYSLLARQEWSSTAIAEAPTVNMLRGFYVRQQFLRSLDAPAQAEPPAIAAEAYAEFAMQAAAYDTRRDFWLQSDYYQQRRQGPAKADAALLDRLIGDIQFTPRDDIKNTYDNIKLTAETAADSNRLLRQYVQFANQRAVAHLNADTAGAWAARTQFVRVQLQRQEAVAQAGYERERRQVEQALAIAQRQGIMRGPAAEPAALPSSELFLLGAPLLQARLEALKAGGPSYDADYDRNQALLALLSAGPAPEADFQTYRYLRTPEEPVARDSPRRVLLLVMWGAVGLLIGAGVALARRPVSS